MFFIQDSTVHRTFLSACLLSHMQRPHCRCYCLPDKKKETATCDVFSPVMRIYVNDWLYNTNRMCSDHGTIVFRLSSQQLNPLLLFNPIIQYFLFPSRLLQSHFWLKIPPCARKQKNYPSINI